MISSYRTALMTLGLILGITFSAAQESFAKSGAQPAPIEGKSQRASLRKVTEADQKVGRIWFACFSTDDLPDRSGEGVRKFGGMPATSLASAEINSDFWCNEKSENPGRCHKLSCHGPTHNPSANEAETFGISGRRFRAGTCFEESNCSGNSKHVSLEQLCPLRWISFESDELEGCETRP